MKRLILSLFALLLAAVPASAKGSFEALKCEGFTAHVYNSNDVMKNTSLIVEGKDGLVLMELPLFKEDFKQFSDYAAALKKPVRQVVTDYHEGAVPNVPSIMPQGMPAFIRGEVYSGMMAHFKKTFGDSIVDIPEVQAAEVPFGATVMLAGVPFTFQKSPSPGFPAANIVIGEKQVYYTHWAFAKAHMNHLQLKTAAAIDAELASAKAALNSGCKYFIGGHGGLAGSDAVAFRLEYLETLKKLRATCPTAEAFATALKKAYPALPGEEGVTKMAEGLYK